MVAINETTEADRTEVAANSPVDLANSHGVEIAAVAKKLCRRNKWASGLVEECDLIQEGMIAAINAAKSFDPSRGCKFWTYAGIRVYGAMVDYLRYNSDLSRDEVRRQFAKNGTVIGTRKIVNGFDRSEDGCLAVECDSGVDAIDDYEFAEKRVLLRCFGGRERGIVRAYFVIGMTLKQIAESIGVCESRVSQILSSVVDESRKECDRLGITAENFSDN